MHFGELGHAFLGQVFRLCIHLARALMGKLFEHAREISNHRLTSKQCIVRFAKLQTRPDGLESKEWDLCIRTVLDQVTEDHLGPLANPRGGQPQFAGQYRQNFGLVRRAQRTPSRMGKEVSISA